MRRLVPHAGVAVVVGSLALLALLLLPAAEAPSRNADDAARESGDPDPAPVVDAGARQLLERAAAAPYAISYSGTQYMSAWTSDRATSQVLQVEHSPAAGTTWRAAGNGTSKGSVVRAAAHSADPSILGVGAVALLARHYSLAGAGTGRVAGRETDVVEARRQGAAEGARSVVARFWLDRDTGLVLRREVYDRGRVIRASAFVDVTVATAQPASGSAGEGGRAWSETLDVAAVRRMRDRGWDCPDSLPGPLPLVDARRGGSGGTDRRRNDIVHLSYADGIASISVFQQRGSLDRERLDGYRRETAGGRTVWVRDEVPRRVVWSAGGTVYTVVADAPERTVDRAVDALHDAAAAAGGDAMDRLGRGLDRVASWFNPFE